MPIELIRNKKPQQIHDDVDVFAPRYVKDWDVWLATHGDGRLQVFGRILRKWQATRPRPMRRSRLEAASSLLRRIGRGRVACHLRRILPKTCSRPSPWVASHTSQSLT